MVVFIHRDWATSNLSSIRAATWFFNKRFLYNELQSGEIYSWYTRLKNDCRKWYSTTIGQFRTGNSRMPPPYWRAILRSTADLSSFFHLYPCATNVHLTVEEEGSRRCYGLHIAEGPENCKLLIPWTHGRRLDSGEIFGDQDLSIETL